MRLVIRKHFLGLVIAALLIIILVLQQKFDYGSKGQPETDLIDGEAVVQGQNTQTEPMALSLNYWEQTANGLRNIFDLQCWAESVNIHKVVEPSIKAAGSSVFHFVTTSKNYFQVWGYI